MTACLGRRGSVGLRLCDAQHSIISLYYAAGQPSFDLRRFNEMLENTMFGSAGQTNGHSFVHRE